MNKRQTQSQFENMFTTQEIFKRNKIYYDAIKISDGERAKAKNRRKPHSISRYNDQKIDHSFQSAKKQRASKVEDDINKYKFRMSFYNTQSTNPENQQTNDKSWNIEPSSPRSIKGVPHEKFLSRESLQKLKIKQCSDERQFTNFYITKNDLSRTPQLGKYSPRNMNIALEHITDLNYNSQKKYEEVYFDSRTNACTFDLKKQNDQKGRYFFVPKRQQNMPATDMKPENVAKSLSVASHFKPGKIQHFYKINGRELPSELEKRLYSPNRNFYVNKDGRLVRPQVSFTARRYKDDLLIRDLQEIQKAKRPYFNRDEICDEMFFKQERRQFQ